ncbi:MAG TPA: hypothetical protein VGE93_18805 [Bryobacteraceae bacterium]
MPLAAAIAFGAVAASPGSALEGDGNAVELTAGSLAGAVADLRCRFTELVSLGGAFLAAEGFAFRVLVTGADAAASGVGGTLSAAAFGFLEEVLSDCMELFYRETLILSVFDGNNLAFPRVPSLTCIYRLLIIREGVTALPASFL